MLPHFRTQPELLDDLFCAVADTGTQEVYVEHINLPKYVKDQMSKTLQGESEKVQEIYKGAVSQYHRDMLTAVVEDLAAKYNLHIRLGGTIYHPELK